MTPRLRELAEGISLYLLLALSVWALWPGVTGPFLFDDFPNLRGLGIDGGVHDLASALRFIFGGGSGPGGRPLALASFLIDDHRWPTDPAPFKITNLWIHAINGVLVFAFLRRLRSDSEAAAKTWRGWPLLATAVWLFHPIQSSAIFLVVQRMTLLASSFELLALLLWLHGRKRLLAGAHRLGYGWMSVAVFVCGGLAVACKESAVTLPLLIWALEYTLAPLPATRAARRWKALCLALPTLLCLGYFLLDWPQLSAGFAIRGFSPWQRVWTELSILADYLYRIAIPQLNVSIFHDDVQALSLVTLTPGAIAAIGVTLLLAPAAVLMRRDRPLYAFALLFFLAGHWLESGPVSLELYFLHRNYLPMLGPVCALASVPEELRGRLRAVGYTLLAAYAALCLTLTRASASVWGDQGRLALDWAEEHPASARAQMYAAQYWATRDDPQRALAYVRRMVARNPHILSPRIAQYYLECETGQEARSHWQRLVPDLGQAEYETTLVDTLGNLHRAIADATCRQLRDIDVVGALQRLLDAPAFATPHARAALALQIARIYQDDGDYASAVGALDYAERAEPSAANLDLQAKLAIAAGQFALARQRIEAEKQISDDPWILRWMIGDAARQERLDREAAALAGRSDTPTGTSPPVH